MKLGEAAWVYEHVIVGWYDHDRPAGLAGPDQNDDLRCHCQFGCMYCREGNHTTCRAVRERAAAEGEDALFSAPETRLFTTRPDRGTWNGRRSVGTPVWLADRVCRVLCRCEACNPPTAATPAAPAMTDEQAAWVREHAWTQGMRKTYREVPAFYTHCDCQYSGGPCAPNPGEPRHDLCHIGVPLPSCETYVCRKDGGVAGFREPYRHPSVSATGWHHVTTAMVWLADRVCRWACPCECGHPRADLAHAAPSPGPRPAPEPAGPPRYELVPLPGFELLGSAR